jgi:hypothetical protein
MALLRQCLQELRAKLREPDAIDGVWPEAQARATNDSRFASHLDPRVPVAPPFDAGTRTARSGRSNP